MLRHRSAIHAASCFAMTTFLCCDTARVDAAEISLRPISSHATSIFAQSAAEIPAYCPTSQRVFVVNAQSARVDVFDLDAQGQLVPIGPLRASDDVTGKMRAVNSVAVHDGLLAVAVEADPVTDPGSIAFYDSRTLRFRAAVASGSLPDMVTFSPDGRWVLVANEGEPNEDYTIDPEGTVTIIDLANGPEEAVARTVNFREWNVGAPRGTELPTLIAGGLRHFGRVTLTLQPYTSRPATFAEDVEPEWIAASSDSRTAYVCLQESNAIAEIDIASATITRLIPLGFKDHGLPGNELDISDQDGGIRIRTWPGLFGVYQPDSIRVYTVDGKRYLVTANEGDSRVRPTVSDPTTQREEGDLFSDEAVLATWPLNGTAWEPLSGPADLGRISLVRDLVDANLDAEGRPTRLFCFGGRSFSIFDIGSGKLVYDSGSDFERVIAERYPEHFNSSSDVLGIDRRSRSKGPEPEALALGSIGDQTYAFIGLERMGGIMIYNITDPTSARFVAYHNNRNFEVPPKLEDGISNPEAGDSGIEGIIFVAGEHSPTGNPLLIAGNETSGTTTVWSIEISSPQGNAAPQREPASRRQ